MGMEDNNRRRTPEGSERGQGTRDYRSSQQARNARAANNAARTREAALQYAELRQKEQAMAKAKRVAALQQKKQSVKDFATKPMSERISDSLFKAIDKTQFEDETGIIDENESAFKRSSDVVLRRLRRSVFIKIIS
jgi:hypothetical protein